MDRTRPSSVGILTILRAVKPQNRGSIADSCKTQTPQNIHNVALHKVQTTHSVVQNSGIFHRVDWQIVTDVSEEQTP